MKKGQISLIIIIGILMILAIIIIYFLSINYSKTNINDKISSDVSPFYNTLINCIDEKSNEAIYLIGLQGGHIFLPEKHLKTDSMQIAYGIKDNQNKLPSIKNIENEINEYLTAVIPLCINDNDFPELTIQENKLLINTKIDQNHISIISNYKLSITKKEQAFELNNPHETFIEIPLKNIYGTADNLIKEQLKNLEYVNLNYIAEQDYQIDILPYNKQTLIYSITDDKSKYVFRFAVEK